MTTQRSLTESATERRWRDLIEGLGAIVWEACAETLRVSFVSREAELLLGYPLEDWQNASDIWSRIIHPEDYDRVVAARSAAAREGRGRAVEYRAIAADGGIVWLRDVMRVVDHGPGRPRQLRGILLDVTERRRAEQALKESEARYRALFEDCRDAVYVTTRDGAFVDINQAGLELLGHTREEIIGSSASTFYADPGDRARFQQEIEAHGSVRDFEVKLRNHHGAALDCLLTSTVRRGSDGCVAGYHGIIHDITGRKQAEEGLRRSERHFRSLIENALDTITVLDRDGIILYESPSVERVLGYRPETLVGQNVFGIVHPDDLRPAREAFRDLVRQPWAIHTTSVRLRHCDGSWRDFEATGKNLLDDRVVAGVVVNARDVTERRQLEEQLQQARQMEAIGRLAGGVAHDFNNLLTAIRGHAQLLLEDLATADPMRTELQEIGKAAGRATSLTRQLLAFSRKQLLQPRVLSLNDVVREMENMLRRVIGEHIELECVLQDELGRAKVDPGQIEQVVLNLALNARDAMPEGGRLTVTTADVVVEGDEAPSLACGAEPGDYVRLAMTDTGVGMSPSTRAQIFEPFFTTKEQGTGLGLSTVYGIIRQTGGHVRVESELGRGTTFEVYLPRVEAEQEPRPNPPAAAVPSGSEAILLVEDEETVRSLAEEVLRRSGYDVLSAANGNEALAVCREHDGPIDLVLTDVVMPEITGHALIEQLLALRPTLRVIFMSGYSEDVVAHQGVLGRASAFLPKPFTPRTLARLVRDVLDGSAQD